MYCLFLVQQWRQIMRGDEVPFGDNGRRGRPQREKRKGCNLQNVMKDNITFKINKG